MKKYILNLKINDNKKICITYQMKEKFDIKKYLPIIKQMLNFILKIIMIFK